MLANKDAIQSLNILLSVMNNELQTDIINLSETNNNMNDMLSGLGIAKIFVDKQLNILFFSPSATKIAKLTLKDVGQSVTSVIYNFLGYTHLNKDAQLVLDTLISKELEVKTNDDKSYRMQIRPYRRIDKIVMGAEISFVDITDIKRVEEKTDKVVTELKEIIKSLSDINDENSDQASELIIVNRKLIFQDKEKAKRASELIIANKELVFQNDEKAKRAAELVIAKKELAFQSGEKADRAAELVIANKELVFQSGEKADRAAELVIANKELIFQSGEKADRAAELIIANKELIFQSGEKADRAAELIISNNEHDFQNKENAEQAAELIIANVYLENLINYANAPIIVLDLKLKITHFNHAFEFITGRNEMDVLGKSISILFPPEQTCKSINYFKNLKKDKLRETSEIDIIHLDCSVRTLLCNSALIYDLDGVTPVSIISQGQDMTDRKKADSEILYINYHDHLTGLYNRRFYEAELIRLNTKENLPITIVMGDVNGLKLINDSFGHCMGDELLQKVAEIIQMGCRTEDLVARLGGDEFVILLPKTNVFETDRIISRIFDLASVEKIGTIDISISFGYATKTHENENIQDVFKKAEDQMYKKKLFESPSMRGKAIVAIINTLHEKNKREEQHSHRVSDLCKKMGEVLELPAQVIKELESVGLLHDIGKIALEENLLNKPGKLTDDEWKEIKRHPEIGYRILSTVNDMSEMADIVLAHHERWDGKGYPKGLKGEEIPYASRIVAIADSYDAMTSERSYRSALSSEVVLAELKKNKGYQFDPNLLKIFIERVIGEI